MAAKSAAKVAAQGPIASKPMPERLPDKPELRCYRCGGSLAALSLPLARLDQCPDCSVDLHVCRMCRHYAPMKPDACDEEDAIVVGNKTAANFCDYFTPDPGAFDGRAQRADDEARRRLADLFGSGGGAQAAASATGVKPELPGASTDGGDPMDAALAAAEKLFRK